MSKIPACGFSVIADLNYRSKTSKTVIYGSLKRTSFVFTRRNPIELLGLVAIFDHVKPKEDTPYWWEVKGPHVRRELMAAAEAKAAGKEQLEGRGSKDRAV